MSNRREIPVVPIPRLVCALCLYVREGTSVEEALTVCEGTAVCENHLPLVAQGLDWHAVLKAAQEQEMGREWND
jgi:hypothetical protein